MLGLDVGAGTVVAAAGSCCARGGATGLGLDAALVANEMSSLGTPGVVAVLGQGKPRAVGEAALASLGVHGASAVPAAASLLGERRDDPFLRPGFEGGALELDGGGAVKPEAAVAMLLAAMARHAARAPPHDRKRLKRVVLAVPPALGPAGTRAVLDAARIAGLPNPEAISASAAAAQCFAAKHPVATGEPARRVLLVDVGYAHAAAAVFDFAPGAPPALVGGAPTGARVGARDFDRRLWEHFAEDIAAKGVEVPKRSKLAHKLMVEVERCKKGLSTTPEGVVELECFGPDERDFRLRVQRATFEGLCAAEVDAIRWMVAGALEAADTAPESLAAVEVVGGATRIPMVRAAICEAAKCEKLSVMLDSASCVALGAAYVAQLHADDRPFAPSTPLPVLAPDPEPEGEAGLGDAEIERLAEAERAMAAADAEHAALADARNELEAYILETRSATSGKHSAVLPAGTVVPVLEEAEEWLYSEEGEEAGLDATRAKLEATRARVVQLAPGYQAALDAEREAMDAELAAAKAEREAQEALEGKDDHDQRKLKFPDRMAKAQLNKEEATTLFKDGNFGPAAQRWAKALQHCDKFFDLSPEQEEEVRKLKVSLHSNIAMANLKLSTEAGNKAAIAACGEVLALEAGNVKALFRRAQAYERLKDYDPARADLLAAKERDGSDPAIPKLLERVDALIAREAAKQKKMYGKMFG